MHDAGPKGPSESLAHVPEAETRPHLVRRAVGWVGVARMGLVVMALIVGAGAGLAAAGFRWLVFTFTWLATGHDEFGQQGHAASIHLPWLGFWFLLVIPAIGGLFYGPLVDRFAPEARGHGVPEVMLAVAENGGRIRPPVTIVKAFASAICIGFGGSVGREGPIVQVGSALASTLGQLVRMSESRLRIIVACGAAGGIAATFNAPITGLFFGFEIVLREFSFDAMFATILAAVTGDVISRAFFGSAPFFTGIPHGLSITSDATYLLVVVLGIGSGLLGLGFKTVLYRLEDLADELWQGRPEWARPIAGGFILGALLLVLPELYGVGYPVMNKVIAGHVVLWLVVLLLLGKILATSLTLSIGGSGGVFAPSLFIGAMAGFAYGTGVHDLFGNAVGPPAMYAVIAMGAVFGGAAQAPLTAIASVIEMTGNFTLTLPVMLATGIGVAISKQLSYGSVYTTKLLRRGIDIERGRGRGILEGLTVADVMRQLRGGPHSLEHGSAEVDAEGQATVESISELIGAVSDVRTPQALFAEESVEQALRQLVIYAHAGLPVVSRDGNAVIGWLNQRDVLSALERSVSESAQEITKAAIAAESAEPQADTRVHVPSTPLEGHSLIEITIGPDSPLRGRRVREIRWPPGWIPLAAGDDDNGLAPDVDSQLGTGARVVLLATGSLPDVTPVAVSTV